MNVKPSESPLACNLAAMDPSRRDRHHFLIQQWTRAIQDVQELPDGYAFRFELDDSLWVALAEYITLERRCCPFLEFTLKLDPKGGPIRLLLTGCEGVKELIRSEFALV